MGTQKDDSVFLREVNWNEYAKYRPRYPPSLEDLILQYHRTSTNSFRLAHDVGSGSGVFAVRLAEYFQHVHVSDAQENFVQQARQNLDKWFRANWWKARLTFSVTTAEKADEVVPSGSVDLVTLMQCAHWTDQDAMVRSVARSLTSRGTLVVVQINPTPVVVRNGKVGEAVRRLFALWGRNILEERGEASLMGTRYLPQGNAGVESIHLPDELFNTEMTQRVEINVQDRGETPHAIPGLEHLVAPSRADPRDRRSRYTSKDAEGQGWRYEVEGAWFRGVVGTLERRENLHLYEEHLQEVEKLVQETSVNGTVEIEWIVAMLLATRK